jgi:hypothetical protein
LAICIEVSSHLVTPCTGIPPEKCYGDWYLPSKYELNLMHKNIGQGAKQPNTNKGGFSSKNYWSSSEGHANYAWSQLFIYGSQKTTDKPFLDIVRAVRAF